MVLDKEDKSCWLTGPLVADLGPVEDGDPRPEAGENVVLSAHTEVRLPVLTGGRVHLARDALYPILRRAAHRVRHPVTNPGGQIIAGLMGRQGRTPPLGPISFIFMHFSAKILRNNRFLFQNQVLFPLPEMDQLGRENVILDTTNESVFWHTPTLFT